MKSHNIFIISLLLIFLTAACGEDNANEATPGTGELEIKFDNRVGTTNLQVNTADHPYTNALGQSFNVTTLRYYISGIQLKKADGTAYEVPMSADGTQGYYLIDGSQNLAANTITLDDVPADAYTGVQFTIGVDANQIEEGVPSDQSPLAETENMFWSWNTGWIFVKFEGTSPASTEEGNAIVYHVGGYSTAGNPAQMANNIRTAKLSFGGDEAEVSSSKRPSVHITVDVLEFFTSPNSVDFSTNASRHSPAANVEIANNYVDAFAVDHIH